MLCLAYLKGTVLHNAYRAIYYVSSFDNKEIHNVLTHTFKSLGSLRNVLDFERKYNLKRVGIPYVKEKAYKTNIYVYTTA